MRKSDELPAIDRRRALSGLRLGRFFGIEIVADWSLMIIFALVLFSLGGNVFPAWHQEWGGPMRWAVASAAAVLFFASVLAHEMSHALVAKIQGIPVRRVTLFMFGGLAHIEGEPDSPRSEFLMAIVGPVTSLAIGLIASAVGFLTLGGEARNLLSSNPTEAMSSAGPIATTLLWLGPINIILGLFNMVPGFPLDGGRVLRSILWWIGGDLRDATYWATRMGRFFGLVLIVSGVAMIFGFQVPIFGTGLVSGFWLALIGWFLRNAASGSYQHLLLRQSLDELTVGQVMRSRIATVPKEISVQSLIDDYIFELEQRIFPVVEADRFVGMVGAAHAKSLPMEKRAKTLVGEIMTPVSEIVTLSPEEPVLKRLVDITQQGVVPVAQSGRVLGLVSKDDLHNRLAFVENEDSS